MKKYKIKYYSVQVEQEVLKLPEKIMAKYFHYTEVMEELGSNLGMPHTKPMGDGLFELRIKGYEGIARVFYCTVVNKEIVMLHSFIKKTHKTPRKELEIAKKRKIEVENG